MFAEAVVREYVEFLYQFSLAEEIATNHALKFKKYNTQGITRDYVRQDTENDFEFLQSRCNYIFLQSLYAYRKVTVLDRDGLEEVLNNLE